MHTSNFTTVNLNSWAEYKNFTDELSNNWAFRGQLNTEWALMNAIERTDFIKNYKGVEADFLSEFQRGARNYLGKDETPEHLIEWLALMQHHGAPTRLLDFSKSPFIAAYFAFEQTQYSNRDIAIWAISLNFLKTQAIEFLSHHFPDDVAQGQTLVHEKLFEKNILC